MKTQRVELEADTWDVVRHHDLGFVFFTADLGLIYGFESEAAAKSACAKLKGMWTALVKAPDALYEVFLTDGEGWGFFDRSGLLHASFPSAQEAQELATKRKEGAS